MINGGRGRCVLAAVLEGILDGSGGVTVRLVGALVVRAGQEAGGTHVLGDVLWGWGVEVYVGRDVYYGVVFTGRIKWGKTAIRVYWRRML